MAYLQLPSGQYLEIPAGMDAAQAAALAQQQFPNEMLTPEEKSSMQGFFPAMGASWSQFLGGTEKTAGSAFGYKPLETLGKKTSAEAGKDYIPTSPEDVSAGFEKGIGSGIMAGMSRFVTEPLGSLVGGLGAPVAAGALAGLAVPEEGIAALGMLGTRAAMRAMGTTVANMPAGFSENLDYQKNVNPDVPPDKLTAVAADLGQSALLGFGVPTFGVFPKLMQSMLGKDVAAMSADIAKGDLSKEAALGQLSSTYSNFMKNAATNYVGLEAMGAGSEALQRWQAGQDVTSPKAMSQYGAGLATGIAPALLFGGLGTIGQRGKQEDYINTAADKADAAKVAAAKTLRESAPNYQIDLAGASADYHQAHANILDAAQRLITPMQEGKTPEDFQEGETPEDFQEGETPEDFQARQVAAITAIQYHTAAKAKAEQTYRTLTGTPAGATVDIPKPISGVVQSNQDILTTQIAALNTKIKAAIKKEDTTSIASLSTQLAALQQKLKEVQAEPSTDVVPPITPEAQALIDELNQKVTNPPNITGVITPEAESLLQSVKDGGVPAMMTNNLKKIAKNNGIKVTKRMTPNDIIEALKAKKTAQSAADQTQTGADETGADETGQSTPAVELQGTEQARRPTLDATNLYTPSDVVAPTGVAEIHVEPDSAAAVAARDLLERSTWAPLPGESETKDTTKARIGLPEMRKVGKDLGLDVSDFKGKGPDVREMALGKIQDEVAYLDNLKVRGTGRDVLPGVQEQQIEPRIAQAVADKRAALNNLYTGLYGLHGSPDTAAPQLVMSALDKLNEKLGNPNLTDKERAALQAEKAQVQKEGRGSTFRTALQEAFAKAREEKGEVLTPEEKAGIKEDLIARKGQRKAFAAQVKESKEAYHDAAMRESAYTRLRQGNEPLTKTEAVAHSAKVKEALDAIENRSKPEVGRVNTALNVRDGKVTAPTLDALHYELHKNDKAVAAHTPEEIAAQKGTPWAPIGEKIAAAHAAYTEPSQAHERLDTSTLDEMRAQEQHNLEQFSAAGLPSYLEGQGVVVNAFGHKNEPFTRTETKRTKDAQGNVQETTTERTVLHARTAEEKAEISRLNKAIANPDITDSQKESLKKQLELFKDRTRREVMQATEYPIGTQEKTAEEMRAESTEAATQMVGIKKASRVSAAKDAANQLPAQIKEAQGAVKEARERLVKEGSKEGTAEHQAVSAEIKRHEDTVQRLTKRLTAATTIVKAAETEYAKLKTKIKTLNDKADIAEKKGNDAIASILREEAAGAQAKLDALGKEATRLSEAQIIDRVNALEKKGANLSVEEKSKLAEYKEILGTKGVLKRRGNNPERTARTNLRGVFDIKKALEDRPLRDVNPDHEGVLEAAGYDLNHDFNVEHPEAPLESKGAKPVEGIGRQGVIDELKGYGAVGAEGHKVQVHETVADFIKSHPEYEGEIDDTTKGMVHKGQAHLFGENIGKGEAQGVFLHEVGAHIGMKNMMPEGAYKGIANKIFDWANKNDGSIENRVAKAAMDRIKEAGTPASQVHDEAIAYTVEEAAKAGVKPTDGPLGNMMQRLKQWFSKAFEKWFGELPPKEMSLQDLVDMAHGAAKVEMGTGIHDEGHTAEPLFSKRHADSDLVNAVTGKDAEKPSKMLTMFRAGLGLRRQIVDKAAAYAKILERVGDNIHDNNYKAAFQMLANIRNYHNSMTYVTEVMSHGGQLFNKEFDTGRGYKQYWPTVEEGAGRVGLPAIGNELKKITGYSAEQLDGLMKTYMAFKREDANPEWKGKLGVNIDPARRAEFLKKWDANPHMQEARRLYDVYNKNLVNGLHDAGVLTSEEAEHWKSRKDYIPYYRMKDGNLELLVEGDTPRVIGDLKNQPWLQELVGGNRPIGGFAEDAMRNTHMLVTSMLHNLASSQTADSLRDLGLAKIVGGGVSGGDVIRFRDKGVMQAVRLNSTAHSDFSDIPVEMLIKGLEGTPQMNSMFIKMMRAPAKATRFLTEMNPLFAARVLLRHSPYSWLTSGSNAIPFIGAIKHVISDIGGKDTSSTTLRRAGVGGGGALHYGDPDAPAIMRYAMGDRGSFTVMGKTLSFFEKNVVRADMGTRATLYDDFLKQGLSEPEAFYASLESMNFSRRGASGFMNSYIQTIPFMNALMQGLDVFYRSARGQMPFNKRLDVQGKLFRRAALISASSVGYALAVRTNPDYQNISEEDRLKNWLIFSGTPGEEPYKLPLPFEPGIFVKSVPEAMVALMHNDAKLSTVTRALGTLVLESVPGGLPEAIAPLVSLGFNHANALSSQEIENQRLQHLLKPARYLPETSELAKAAGEYTGNPWIKQHLGFTEGLSPVQLDYLAKEYLGGMGSALTSLFNHVGMGVPRPSMLPHQIPILGGIRQDVSGNGIIGDFLDRTAQAAEMKNTLMHYYESGQKAKGDALLKAYPEWLGEGAVADAVAKPIGELSKEERMITDNPNISPERKRLLINNYQKQRSSIVQTIQSLGANKQ